MPPINDPDVEGQGGRGPGWPIVAMATIEIPAQYMEQAQQQRTQQQTASQQQTQQQTAQQQQQARQQTAQQQQTQLQTAQQQQWTIV